MQIRIVISGFVQGVGFRYYIQDQAQGLGITGWTANTTDGRVEAVLQGEEQRVRELIELCRKGPMLSQVEKIEEMPSNEPKYEDFIIKNS